jgi:hypothetical protein
MAAAVPPHITSKMVTSPNDADLPGFFRLYDSLFPDDEKTSFEDIKRWIQESAEEGLQDEPEYQEVLILVKAGAHVAAFLNFTFYFAERMIFISYYGIDRAYRADDRVRDRVFRRLAHYARKMAVRYIVFESERATNERIPSRIRLYKQAAASLHVPCYELLFDFVQPILLPEQLNTDATEVHMALGCIPTAGLDVPDGLVSRDVVLDILHFVYARVYGESFIGQGSYHEAYKTYMLRLLQDYADTLPEMVPVR